MVMDGEQNGVRPRNGVNCTVEWTRRSVSVAEVEEFGELLDEVSVNVFIAPEMQQPKANVNGDMDWTTSEQLHPFWYVKRGQPEDKTNMELVFLPTSQILACEVKPLKKRGAPVTSVMETVSIQYPCLVNTVDLGADEELVLEWSQLGVKNTPKSAKGQSAFDQLVQDERQRKMARLKDGTEA